LPLSVLRIGFFAGCCLLWMACSRRIQSQSVMFSIPFEQHPNQTVTYAEAIACYEKMAAARPDIFKFTAVGSTDIGEPLHVAVLSTDGLFEPEAIRKAGKRILLINNGIHPGEPEGIDATILLLRELLSKPDRLAELKHMVLVVIPVYNVDGCLNRGSALTPATTT
jgi:Zinc carboxypeptidase